MLGNITTQVDSYLKITRSKVDLSLQNKAKCVVFVITVLLFFTLVLKL